MQASCLDRSHLLQDNCEVHVSSVENAWLLKLLRLLGTACVPLRFSEEVICDLEGTKLSVTVLESVGRWTQIISLVRRSSERQSMSAPVAILSDCPPSLSISFTVNCTNYCLRTISQLFKLCFLDCVLWIVHLSTLSWRWIEIVAFTINAYTVAVW